MGTKHDAKDHEGLVLIQVKRMQLNKRTEESTWAKPLGDDLYEIRGPLHLITGLNSYDIVKAVVRPGDSLPSVSGVVRRSGFRTLHLVFFESVPLVDQKELLEVVTQWNTRIGNLFDRFYTLEVSPDGDYPAVCSYLKSLRAQELIMHEPEVGIDALLRFRFLG